MRDYDTGRNLLFVAIALQMDFITREQLIAAARDWTRAKTQTMGGVLVRQGVIEEDTRSLLERLIDKHLEQRGDDSGRKLGAMTSLDSVREDLQQLGDDDVGKSLDQLTSDTGKGVAATDVYLPRGDAEEREAEEKQEAGGSGSKRSGGSLPAARKDETEPHPSGASEASSDPGRQRQRALGATGVQRYRVVAAHARGGLGKVSVAVDEELNREVAFKELLEHWAHDGRSRDRFLMEAEITGRLEHPGIVPVYGLGVHPDGRPYYAMRFVRGDTLKEAIDRFHSEDSSQRDPSARSVEFRQLLGRFIDTCNAVQYAHSRGVVHRDLKPDNVMLGKYGETLVVDWGLAKAAGRDPSAAANDETTLRPILGSGSAATQLGSVIGTPAYMSPEQASGHHDRVTAASDVYSLGATLFSLLTGRKPVEGTSTTEVVENVREGRILRARDVHRRTPAPLDAICTKAMALKPEDRYGSPAFLAEDIEHWMADEPVIAYRESFRERALRWMRRHRNWVQAAAAALVVVAVAACVTAILVEQWRQKAEQLADENLQLAHDANRLADENHRRYEQAREAVDTWLMGTSEALTYYPGVQRARAWLLEQAARDYEEFTRQYSDDVALEVERGRIYQRLGDVRRLLGQQEKAERAHRDAQRLLQRLRESHPEEDSVRVELANSHVRLGTLYSQSQQNSRADKEYCEAIAQLEALLKERPAAFRASDSLGACLFEYGMLLEKSGNVDEAASCIRRSVALFQKLVDDRPDDPGSTRRLAKARLFLGKLRFDDGWYGDSRDETAEAVVLLDSLAQKAPDDPRRWEARADARIFGALVERRLGRYDEERAAFEQAIDDYVELTRALPDAPAFRERLAKVQVNLGQLQHRLGRNQQARDELLNAMSAFGELANRYPQESAYLFDGAACQDMLSRVHRDLGHADDALAVSQQAVAILQQFVDNYADVVAYQRQLACAERQLGKLLHEAGDHEDARLHFENAVTLLDRLVEQRPMWPACTDELARTCEHFAALLEDLNEPTQATTRLNLARQLRMSLVSPPDGRPIAAEYLDKLARLLTSCADDTVRDPSEAVKYALDAVKAAPQNAEFHSTLGAAQCRSERWTESIDTLGEAIRLRGEATGQDGFFLAIANVRLGRTDKACECFQLGCDWMERECPGNLEMRRIGNEAAEALGEDLPGSSPPKGAESSPERSPRGF